MMQFCTCGTQFFEHIGTYNSYHIPEPWTVLRYFNPDNNGPPLSITSSGYSNDANSPLPPKPRRPPVTAPSCFPATRWRSHSLPHTCPLSLLTSTHPTLTVTRLSSPPCRNPLFKRPSLRSRLFPTRKWRIPTAFYTRTITSVSTSRTRVRDFTRIIPTVRRTARKPGPVNLIRYQRTNSIIHPQLLSRSVSKGMRHENVCKHNNVCTSWISLMLSVPVCHVYRLALL